MICYKYWNIVNLKQKDELGELSNAFNKLLDEKVTQLSLSEKQNDELNESVIALLTSVAQLSRKDFTVKVPVFEDVTGAVGDSLNLLTKETADALNEVRKIIFNCFVLFLRFSKSKSKFSFIK